MADAAAVSQSTMREHQLTYSEDLPALAMWGASVLAVVALSLLVWEVLGAERRQWHVLVSGGVAIACLLLAIARPVAIDETLSPIGPRIVVLLDTSRRLELPAEPGGSTSRWERAGASLDSLRERFPRARIDVHRFAEAPTRSAQTAGTDGEYSNLSAALQDSLMSTEGVDSLVVISDGRFERPLEPEELRHLLMGTKGFSVQTVRLAEETLPDVSIRAIRMPAVTVAHQPFPVEVEVAATGDLAPGTVTLGVKELRRGGASAVLASGEIALRDGIGTLRLPVTLERAGSRLLDFSISATRGDQVPENDRRVLTVPVTRDRVRLLHIAGRPTYDVRALRTWLKSDQAIDVVTFFILRTKTDDANTVEDSELALIPFPVHELFTEHLSSFDAIIVQDIDAVEYELAEHLLALARYVEAGGGLVMVGGPGAFAAGSYAQTPLQSVMPVELVQAGRPYDALEFRPRYTETGRAAPVTRPLRQLLGEQLPAMIGANRLGGLRRGALALWEHGTHSVRDGSSMPILAIGRAGDGRTIALGIDGSYRLAYGELAARTDGRAYGALWDALLGWLMRDPRYEAAQVELDGPCIVGRDARLVVSKVPGVRGPVSVDLQRLDGPLGASEVTSIVQGDPSSTVHLSVSEAGGYSADVSVGDAPPSRVDFACESGGEAWRDSRPDPGRLEALARLGGGASIGWNEVHDLPDVSSFVVVENRRAAPLAPAWLWSLLAAATLGAHWLLRRRAGLS